jgi:hypothetical protein
VKDDSHSNELTAVGYPINGYRLLPRDQGQGYTRSKLCFPNMCLDLAGFIKSNLLRCKPSGLEVWTIAGKHGGFAGSCVCKTLLLKRGSHRKVLYFPYKALVLVIRLCEGSQIVCGGTERLWAVKQASLKFLGGFAVLCSFLTVERPQ